MWYFELKHPTQNQVSIGGKPKKHIKHYSVHYLVCPYQLQGFDDSGVPNLFLDGWKRSYGFFVSMLSFDRFGWKETIDFFMNFFIFLFLDFDCICVSLLGHFLGKRFCLVKNIPWTLFCLIRRACPYENAPWCTPSLFLIQFYFADQKSKTKNRFIICPMWDFLQHAYLSVVRSWMFTHEWATTCKYSS